MPTAVCPSCEEPVHVRRDCELGEIVICEDCDTGLELVGQDPIELDPVDSSAASNANDFDDFALFTDE